LSKGREYSDGLVASSLHPSCTRLLSREMSNNYRRLDTGDSPSSLMAIYQRNPLSRLWQLHAHKSYVRLSLYGFLSLCTISLLYNMFVTSTPAGPAIPYPPEHFEDANLEPPHVWKDRADKVRQAFIHAYRGYEYNAFGHDELRPLSNKAKDKYVRFPNQLVRR
jgi:hypothetical protein